MPGGDEMRPTHSGVKLTYDDYVLFPEDGKRHELIDGEHYVSPAPSRIHQRISMNVAGLIWSYLREHRIGQVFTAPFDVIFSHFDVVQPDIVYLSRERMAEIETDPYVKGAPNLLVEIGSASTRRRDKTIKRRLYERFGVEEYWVVDPNAQSIKVFRQQSRFYVLAGELSLDSGDVLTTSILPGLELPLATIFED
jgi:Uma2 family endonuclease